jgi:hypothetical protein
MESEGGNIRVLHGCDLQHRLLEMRESKPERKDQAEGPLSNA